MIFDVPLYKESEKLIAETFSEYKEGKELPKTLHGRTVIHMYPVKDTYDENGQLNGFIDSLFFRFDIYNIPTKKVYRKNGLYDEFVIDVPTRVRAFKDLSTMIVIEKSVRIEGFQSILIYPV